MIAGFFRYAVVKDLRLVAYDTWKPALWIGVPLVVGSLITLVMGGDDAAQPSVHLLVADEDDSLLSRMLSDGIRPGDDGQLFRIEKVDQQEGRSRLNAGEASALLVIPAGFGDALLREEPSELVLVKNPAERILPEIAEGTIRILLDGAFYAHRVFGKELKQVAEFDADSRIPDLQIASLGVRVNQVIRRLEKYLDPMVMELATSVDQRDEEDDEPDQGFSLTFLFMPGILFMGLFFVAEGLAMELWTERQSGALRRLMTTPQGVPVFLASKLAAGMVWFGVVSLVLLLIGMAYHARPLIDLPLAVAWSILSGAILLLCLQTIQLLASSQRAGAVLSNSLMFPLIMIGGSLFPFEAMPEWMEAIGRRTPNGWMLTELKGILTHEAGFSRLAVSCSALLVLLAVLFSINCCVLKSIGSRE